MTRLSKGTVPPVSSGRADSFRRLFEEKRAAGWEEGYRADPALRRLIERGGRSGAADRDGAPPRQAACDEDTPIEVTTGGPAIPACDESRATSGRLE